MITIGIVSFSSGKRKANILLTDTILIFFSFFSFACPKEKCTTAKVNHSAPASASTAHSFIIDRTCRGQPARLIFISCVILLRCCVFLIKISIAVEIYYSFVSLRRILTSTHCGLARANSGSSTVGFCPDNYRDCFFFSREKKSKHITYRYNIIFISFFSFACPKEKNQKKSAPRQKSIIPRLPPRQPHIPS